VHLKPIAGLLTSLLLFLVSCKPEPTAEPGRPLSRFSATVNGKSFLASDFQASLGPGFVSLAGEQNGGTGKAIDIVFTVAHYAGPATYVIDTANSASYIDNTGTYNAKSGSISIATYNDVHVAGTFAFDAVDSVGESKSVNAGSFDYYR
jgi:hypothetical protein